MLIAKKLVICQSIRGEIHQQGRYSGRTACGLGAGGKRIAPSDRNNNTQIDHIHFLPQEEHSSVMSDGRFLLAKGVIRVYKKRASGPRATFSLSLSLGSYHHRNSARRARGDQ
jgi:hypothetical protein